MAEEVGRLAENILYFARALRAAGIPLGPGSVLDALAAVWAAGVGGKEDFYWTLHAVFVKRHEHSVLFDQAFKIFFRKRGYLERLIAMMSPDAPALEAFVRKKGLFSFYEDGHHECCGLRKVEPLRRAVSVPLRSCISTPGVAACAVTDAIAALGPMNEI